MDYVVYTYSDPRDGNPFYIGAGRMGREAWHSKHVLALMGGSNKGHRTSNAQKIALISDIIESGLEPIIEVVFVGSRNDAFEIEKYLVSEIGRKDMGLGPLLNLRDGGIGGANQKWSERARQRKSVASTGSGNSFYGKKHSEETKSVIRNKRKLRPSPRHSFEHRAYLSEVLKKKNPNIRKYEATSPDGHIYSFSGGPDWCRKMGFSINTFYGMTVGGAKSPKTGPMAGWFVRAVPHV